MTIENLINIIDGKLINEPSIAKIEAATVYPSKVERGDLFFAFNSEDIEKAIENGAYAIVFEGNIKIKDPEIAYISVDSIKSATLNFLRYILIAKKLKVFLFEDIEISLLKQISKRKTIYTFLDTNWQKTFEQILNSDYEILITNNQNVANSLTPNFETLIESESGYIVSDTLLKTTFRLDGFIYQDMQLSPIFFENLLKVVKFCKNNHIEYDINRLKYTKEFKPIYINSNLTPLINTTSDKVLIFMNSKEYIQKAYNYLSKESKWIKSIIIAPINTKFEINKNPIWFKNANEAKEILKKEFFNFAFCYQIEPEEILNKDENSYRLF